MWMVLLEAVVQQNAFQPVRKMLKSLFAFSIMNIPISLNILYMHAIMNQFITKLPKCICNIPIYIHFHSL